jgi:hypothetical protein
MMTSGILDPRFKETSLIKLNGPEMLFADFKGKLAREVLSVCSLMFDFPLKEKELKADVPRAVRCAVPDSWSIERRAEVSMSVSLCETQQQTPGPCCSTCSAKKCVRCFRCFLGL